MNTHIISDSCTRIRNAQLIKKRYVELCFSNFVVQMLKVLEINGYILGFKILNIRTGVFKIRVFLKYNKDLNNPSITEIRTVSKPGRKVYCGYRDIKSLYGGLGIVILSTSRGIVSDYEAFCSKVGGEVICKVF